MMKKNCKSQSQLIDEFLNTTEDAYLFYKRYAFKVYTAGTWRKLTFLGSEILYVEGTIVYARFHDDHFVIPTNVIKNALKKIKPCVSVFRDNCRNFYKKDGDTYKPKVGEPFKIGELG